MSRSIAARNKHGALTDAEKPIVKVLLAKGWRNQDIQALVNVSREATINGARITGISLRTRNYDSGALDCETIIDAFNKIRISSRLPSRSLVNCEISC